MRNKIRLIKYFEHFSLFFVILIKRYKMDNKCSKYEGLFVFSDEESLKSHLQECEDCRAEQEVMDKVSALISEVKPYYLAKDKKRPKLRVACAMLLLVFSTLTFGFVASNDDLKDTLMYGDTLSAEDLGFPVDSYGLLMVDE